MSTDRFSIENLKREITEDKQEIEAIMAVVSGYVLPKDIKYLISRERTRESFPEELEALSFLRQLKQKTRADCTQEEKYQAARLVNSAYDRINEQKREKQSKSLADKLERAKGKERIAMDLVQDINTKGIAYSAIGVEGAGGGGKTDYSKKIKDLLAEGLLGATEDDKISIAREGVSQWFHTARKRHQVKEDEPEPQQVYFNIVGRSSDILDPGKTEIEQSHYVQYDNYAQSGGYGGHGIVILFDTSSFREDVRKNVNMQDVKSRAEAIQVKHHHYRNENYKEGEPATASGFVVAPRVAPLLFRGIALNRRSAQDLDKIVQQMDEAGRWLPVYDLQGNLLWPKQMTYEEVKKFVGTKKALSTDAEHAVSN